MNSSTSGLSGSRSDPAARLWQLWHEGQRPDLEAFLRDLGEPTAENLLVLVRIDQEQRWQRGECLRAEHYFQAHAALRQGENALVLIYSEFLLRERRGEAPRAEEYLERFPDHAEALRVQFDLHRALHSMSAYLGITLPHEPGTATLTRLDLAQPWPSLPDYEILQELGRGGMGVVYQARQHSLKRLVAIKMIRADLAADPDFLARFRAEAETVARLQHPHFVQVHEIGSHQGQPYFVLEYVGGGSLAAHLEGKPLVPGRAAALVCRLAGAMHAAHERGIVHRDLKPGNILLGMGDGGAGLPGAALFDNVKIADFGLAKQLDEEAGQTQTGAIVGTPSYMAPEQAQPSAAGVGPPADVYALGAILYECLTGRPPFQGTGALDTLQQVCQVEPVPPARLQPGVPADLDTICLKCLEKDAGRRYASARALADDLERFLTGRPIEARPAGAVERAWKWARRRPAAAALLAGGIGAAVVVVGLLAGLWQQAEAKAVAEAGQSRAEHERADATEKARQDETARFAAEAELGRSAARSAANLALDRALELGNRGDVPACLLWLVRALTHAGRADDTHLKDVCRVNLAAWSSRLLVAKAVLQGDGSTLAVAFRADGKMLLTGSRRGTAQLWNAAGQLTGPALAHGAAVRGVAFSDAGQAAVTAGDDRKIRFWHVATGAPNGEPLTVPEQIFTFAASPDGKRLATTTLPTERAQLWDADARRPIGELLPHPGVYLLAFSADGKTLVTAGRDGNARLWESATGKPAGAPFVHGAALNAVALSPDGQTLATAGEDGSARLWDVATGQPRGEKLVHARRVRSVDFAPDGQRVLTASADGTARLWDARTSKPVGEPLQHPRGLVAAHFGPDGRLIVTLDGSRMQLWDAHALCPLGQPLRSLRGLATAVFSPDSSSLVTVPGLVSLLPIDTPENAILWQVVPGQAVPPVLAQAGSVRGVCFDGEQALLAVSDRRAEPGQEARRWQVDTGRLLATPLLLKEPASATAVSSDGRWLLVTQGNRVQLWDVVTGQRVGPPLESRAAVWAAVFSADGRFVLAGSGTPRQGQEVRIWETATGKAVGKPVVIEPGRFVAGPATETIAALVLAPAGRTVLIARRSRLRAAPPQAPQLWDLAAGKQRALLAHLGVVVTAAFSPDGRILVTGSEDHHARLWDVATGAPLGTAPLHEDTVTAVAFSPEGRLATGSADGTARLWDGATGRALGVPLAHPAAVRSVRFVAEGQALVTTCADRGVRLWDVASGRQLGPPLGHEAAVEAVAISPRGERLAVGCADGGVRIWHLPGPLEGGNEQLQGQFEEETGMKLEEDGVMRERPRQRPDRK